MKIGIHKKEGSFSDAWIRACEHFNLDYDFVDMYSDNIIENAKKYDAILWNWHHASPKDWLFARQILTSLNKAKIKVFPDIETCWHFDDKIGQKYLFEAIGAPAVESHVFYEENVATDWLSNVQLPVVFKLRSGAGATNVRLVRSQKEGRRLIKRMFGRGFPSVTLFVDMATSIRKKKKSGQLLTKIFQSPSIIKNVLRAKRLLPRQRGYVYFQDFIPDNKYDTRIVVIGNRAIGIRRYCRPNDFRASGSGEISYEKENIPIDCINIAFDTTRKMNSQCAAFDFVCNTEGHYLIVEVSYAFTPDTYYKCEGYWSPDGCWHDEPVKPEEWMIQDLLGLERV